MQAINILLGAALVAFGSASGAAAPQHDEASQPTATQLIEVAQSTTGEGSMPLRSITDDNFGPEVLNADLPYVVFFATTWCGPCTDARRTLQELAYEFRGQILIGEVNADDYPNLWRRYGARSLPVTLAFLQGTSMERFHGAVSKDRFRQMVELAITRYRN